MSKEIEEKVLSMAFDNSKFEKNCEKTISTLDRLRSRLNFKDSADGLKDLDSAAKKINFSTLGIAVEEIGVKFSSMQIMAKRALENITDQAMRTGKRLVESLSTDQISTGFSKYTEKTANVQTLVNSTGKSIEEINGYLQRLMWFSDETSYSFTDMTSALSQMTSAGGDIDKLMPMITGIANATAFAGKGATEFASTIRNLSQSYSAGYLQLQDMKSLNLMGTSSKQLKETFISVAESLGKIKKGDVTVQTFDQTLKDKWADTEVMEKALSKFSALSDAAYEAVRAGEYDTASEAIEALAGKYDDLAVRAFKSAQEAKSFTEAIEATKDAVSSGWMATFDTIFGTYDEAKVLWTEVANRLWEDFASGAEARNEMLLSWKDLGGRDAIVQSLWNSWDGVREILASVGDAFREVFPEQTANDLMAFSNKLKNLTDTFKNLFKYTDPDELKKQLADGIIDKETFARLKEANKRINLIKEAFRGLFNAAKIVLTVIKDIGNGIVTLVKKLLNINGAIASATDAMSKWINGVAENIKEHDYFAECIQKITDLLGKLIDRIEVVRKAINEKIKLGAFEILNKILANAYKLLRRIGDLIVTVGKKLGTFLGTIFRSGGIKGALEILNGGIFMSILLEVKNVFTQFRDFGSTIKETMVNFRDAILLVQDSIKANVMRKIAISLLLFAAALILIASIDPSRLLGSLTVMVGLIAQLVGATKLIGKVLRNLRKVQTTKIATLFLSMAASVLILSFALRNLAKVDAADLAKGIVAIGFIMLELVGITKLMGKMKTKGMIKASIAMIIMGAALEIFANLVGKFGKYRWKTLGKAAAAIGGILVLAAGFGLLNRYTKKVIKGSLSLVIMGGALEIFANLVRKFGNMEWSTLGKAGAAIGGILLMAATFGLLNRYTKKVIKSTIALGIMGVALEIFANLTKKFGNMDWSVLGKAAAAIGGLLIMAAAFGIIAGFAHGMLKSSIALVVMADALLLMVPVMKTLGSMEWISIAKGLATIAGIFVILGAAGYLLSPIIGVILALSAAVVILGVGLVAIGGGLILMASGITALGVAMSVGLDSILAGLYTLTVGLIGLIGEIIVAICDAIANSAQSLYDAFKTIVLVLIGVFKDCIPPLVEAVLYLVRELLRQIDEYIPVMVGILFDIVIKLINTFADKIPDLVKAIVRVLKTLFVSVGKALKEFNVKEVIQGVEGVAAIAGMMYVLASVASLTIPAMIGVAGVIAVLSELGAINQIPGINWLVKEGLDLLATIGEGIGKFFGKLISSFAVGITSNLPAIATNMSNFMENLEPFLKGLNNIKPSMFDAAATLSKTILVLTEAGLLERIASFITGGSGIAAMAKELPKLATGISEFDRITSGVNGNRVKAAAAAAKTLAEMADAIPNTGGLVALFTGENSVAKFGDEIKSFGENLANFSTSVTDVDADKVKAASEAGKALADMADTVPDEGGLKAWFLGDNSVAKFGKELKSFGKNLANFSNSVANVDPENVKAAAESGKALADMANRVPDEGGVKAWFAGDNSVAKFGKELKSFGKNLATFSTNVADVKPENVKKASDAGKELASMADTIPNTGGLKAWFVGDNSVAKFGKELKSFGKNLAAFSNNVTGVDVDAVRNASNAGKELAVMADTIPDEGGVKAWFAGDNSVAKFGSEIAFFGLCLADFSNNVADLDAEAVKNAANAGKSLAEMTNALPNQGGMKSWFVGDKSIAKMATDLPTLGTKLSEFSTNLGKINSAKVQAAASAGKSLAEMTSYIPSEGGMKAWFAGDINMAKFGTDIASFGSSLSDFSTNVTGIDTEAIKAAAESGKALAEMTQTIPDEGGVKAWFAGDNNVAKFGTDIASFGSSLSEFSTNVTGIDSEAVKAAAEAGKNLAKMVNTVPTEGGMKAWFVGKTSVSKFGKDIANFGSKLSDFATNVGDIDEAKVKAASTAGKNLAQMVNTIPSEGGMKAWFTGEVNMTKFGSDIAKFGSDLADFSTNVTDVDSDKIKAASEAGKNLAEMVSKMAKADIDDLTNFGEGLIDFGESLAAIDSVQFKNKSANISAALSGMVESIGKEGSSYFNVGEGLAEKLVAGLKSKNETIKKTTTGSLDTNVENIKAKKSKYHKAGTTIASNLLSGMKSKNANVKKTFLGSLDADVENINSKIADFEAAGKNLAQGLINGMKSSRILIKVENAAYNLGVKAVKGELDGQQSHSPSKATYKAGIWLGQGLINGTKSMYKKVYDSSEDLGIQATDGISEALKSVSEYMNSDMETQPTIRPVLDISDVANGVGKINGMFDMSPSMSVASNARDVANSMSARQNRTTGDVVDAINRLNDNSGAVGDTYNINGITYDDGSNIYEAVQTLVRAAKVERRT